jgi:aspartate aminotransferase-like enzyme
MPTDSLATLRDVIKETEAYGFDKVMAEQLELGTRVRSLLSAAGFKSVAAEGFEAPGVVVCYTDDDGIRSGKKFADAGLQIAPGVPLQCDEPADFKTFRIGLFGLDKLHDVESAVARLAKAVDGIV